jgi:hypothetical protein
VSTENCRGPLLSSYYIDGDSETNRFRGSKFRFALIDNIMKQYG